MLWITQWSRAGHCCLPAALRPAHGWWPPGPGSGHRPESPGTCHLAGWLPQLRALQGSPRDWGSCTPPPPQGHQAASWAVPAAPLRVIKAGAERASAAQPWGWARPSAPGQLTERSEGSSLSPAQAATSCRVPRLQAPLCAGPAHLFPDHGCGCRSQEHPPSSLCHPNLGLPWAFINCCLLQGALLAPCTAHPLPSGVDRASLLRGKVGPWASCSMSGQCQAGHKPPTPWGSWKLGAQLSPRWGRRGPRAPTGPRGPTCISAWSCCAARSKCRFPMRGRGRGPGGHREAGVRAQSSPQSVSSASSARSSRAMSPAGGGQLPSRVLPALRLMGLLGGRAGTPPSRHPTTPRMWKEQFAGTARRLKRQACLECGGQSVPGVGEPSGEQTSSWALGASSALALLGGHSAVTICPLHHLPLPRLPTRTRAPGPWAPSSLGSEPPYLGTPQPPQAHHHLCPPSTSAWARAGTRSTWQAPQMPGLQSPTASLPE